MIEFAVAIPQSSFAHFITLRRVALGSGNFYIGHNIYHSRNG